MKVENIPPEHEMSGFFRRGSDRDVMSFGLSSPGEQMQIGDKIGVTMHAVNIRRARSFRILQASGALPHPAAPPSSRLIPFASNCNGPDGPLSCSTRRGMRRGPVSQTPAFAPGEARPANKAIANANLKIPRCLDMIGHPVISG